MFRGFLFFAVRAILKLTKSTIWLTKASKKIYDNTKELQNKEMNL